MWLFHAWRIGRGSTCCFALLLIAFVTMSANGAVRRRLTINSNPSGALVYVDNQQVGTTPCSVDFVYYGTREIRLIKPGFETLTVNQPIPAPWYEYVPFDLVSETVVPMKIRDNRTVTFNLAPQLAVPTPELLGRASQLRQDTLQYGLAPATPAPPGFVPGPVIAGPAISPAPMIAQPPAPMPAPLPGINPPPTMNQPTVTPGISPPPFAPQASPQPSFGPPAAGAPILPPNP
jgi:hypothetical protein